MPPPLFPGKLNPLFLSLRIPNCSITRKKGKEICFDAICGSLPSGLNKNPPTKLKNNDWHCKDSRSNNTTIIEVLLCTRRPSNRAFHKISTRIFFLFLPLPLLPYLKRRDVQIVGMHCMLLAPPPPPLLCNQTVSPSPRDLYLQRPPDRLCKNMRRSPPRPHCLPIYQPRLTNPWVLRNRRRARFPRYGFPRKIEYCIFLSFFSGTRQSTWLLLQRRKKGVRSLSPPPPPVYFFSPLLTAFSAPSRFPSPFKCLFSYLLARVLGNGGRRKWTRENAK